MLQADQPIRLQYSHQVKLLVDKWGKRIGISANVSVCFFLFYRTPKVKENVGEKTQPSTSGLSARSIRHTQRLLFKSEEDHVDDASSTVSHDGHMSDDDSGDEIMFRNEERCISGVGGIQPKSRIPVPVNGLFSSHVVNKKYLILLLKIIINMCSTIYLFGSVK